MEAFQNPPAQTQTLLYQAPELIPGDAREGVFNSAIFLIFIYTTLHACGHALAAFLVLSEIEAQILDLWLQGPDGWESIRLPSEQYTASQDRINTGWDLLPVGHYDLVVTVTNTQGKLSVFVKP